MEEVKGEVLYNIELDGCLNGVYTNDDLDGEIFNEIARIRSGKSDDNLSGIYDCSYFDKGKTHKNAELTISKNGKRTYKFSWNVKDETTKFEGIGYKMNEKQIVVHYKMLS